MGYRCAWLITVGQSGPVRRVELWSREAAGPCGGTVKSIDIMTLMTVMVSMEETNSFLAQIRSSDVL